MPLTKEDLQAIQNLVESAVEKKLGPIEANLSRLENRFGGLENKFDEFESKTGERFKGLKDWFVFELDTQITPLKERILNLPTKEEHFSRMDALVTEVQEYRMERVALGSQVDRLKQRVETIEARVGIEND